MIRAGTTFTVCAFSCTVQSGLPSILCNKCSLERWKCLFSSIVQPFLFVNYLTQQSTASFAFFHLLSKLQEKRKSFVLKLFLKNIEICKHNMNAIIEKIQRRDPIYLLYSPLRVKPVGVSEPVAGGRGKELLRIGGIEDSITSESRDYKQITVGGGVENLFFPQLYSFYPKMWY